MRAIFLLALVSAVLAGCNQTSATDPSGVSASLPAAFTPNTGLPLSSTAAYVSDGTADLSWTAPTTNTDGSALTDLAGYRIYYGSSPDALNESVDISNVSTTNYVINGLRQGTWYFAIRAYTNTDLESSLSQVVDKTIT